MQHMKDKEKIIIYSADASNRSITLHLRNIIQDLPNAHELGLRLFKRNLRASYRQSLLGVIWTILPPLATAALWIILRSNNVVSMKGTGISYPVFVLAGTILWQIFTEAVSAPINQMTENRAMISKVNIPREGLLLAGAYQLIFNIIIKILLLVLIFVSYRQPISLTSLALVPLGLFAISLAGFSIGLALSPLGMLYQDISKGLAVFLPFFMYLTPVVYPAPQEGSISLIMKWNPLATLITTTRNWLVAQPVYDMQLFWVVTLAFALLFMMGLAMYRLSMPMIIERTGS